MQLAPRRPEFRKLASRLGVRYPGRVRRGQGRAGVVYLLRDYPSLSQTFVRNEIVSLRERGRDVAVFSMRASNDGNVPDGWGGDSTVAFRRSRPHALLDLLILLLRRPRGLLAMTRQVAATGQQSRWAALYLAPHVARTLLKKPVAASHTHFAFEHAWASLYLARLLQVPASITVHAADIYRDPPAAVAMLRHFDTVVTVCTYNVEFLRSSGLAGRAIYEIPCGVAVPDVISIPDGEKEQLDNRLTKVLSVGRFVPKKGFSLLLHAWVEVRSAIPSATLEIVGDGPLLADMESLSRELNLTSSVRFIGAAEHGDVLDYISHCDVFVLACVIPSDGDSDALPVVIREAMARAKPVVSTAVAGVEQAIGSAGWVVPPGDENALAAALVAAMSSPSLARFRGASARERVLSDATLEIAAEQLERLMFADAGAGEGRQP